MNLTGKLGGKLPPSSVEGMTLRVTAGNMAAALGRLLSFSKNARVLRSTLTPVHRYSVEVSSAGEPITHTGQVGFKPDIFRGERPDVKMLAKAVVSY